MHMQITDELKKRVYELAIENFRNGLNCTESVYDALLRSGALQAPKETLAMCVGFGGGVGLSGSVCGALTAAIMANGAVHGRPDPWNSAPDAETRGKEMAGKYYRRYNNLANDFAAKNGSLACADICAPFEWTSKERRKNCMYVVADTAVLALGYLAMPQETAFALPYKKNIAGLDPQK